jgi:glycolate oxidase FAD binding subunit
MVTTTRAKSPAEAVSPGDQAGIVDVVRAAYEARQPVYPMGGATALDYGNPSTRPGIRLGLTSMAGIVDYTPRDMTILVEAGIRMADLAATLAAEGQQLPIDVPRSSEATIGGVVATNWSGPRRYGYGTVRDYVIGIHAVDGRGVAFKGGGRVVKNVAGYDFCKLLTGSLGTLAVITQLALKVKPLAETAATLVAECRNLAQAETVLARLANLEAPPVTIDLLIGTAWQQMLDDRVVIAVRIEGTAVEVAWLAEQVEGESSSAGTMGIRRLGDEEAAALWSRQIEFSDRGAGDAPDDSPLVLKIAVPPNAVTAVIADLQQRDENCSIQAHAGSGIVYARFSRFDAADVTRVLVGKLRPAALQRGGSLVVVSHKFDGLTPHILWGGRTEASILAERIKQKFDPHNILNPGRFII